MGVSNTQPTVRVPSVGREAGHSGAAIADVGVEARRVEEHSSLTRAVAGDVEAGEHLENVVHLGVARLHVR